MVESKVYKKYKNLYGVCCDNPQIQLYSNGKVKALYFNEKEFVENHPENGFYEKFGLSKEDKNKVKIYRAHIKR